MKSFTVKGSLIPQTYLGFEIQATDKAKEWVANGGTHYLILEDVSRVFDATDYRKNGFKDPVSGKEYGIVIDLTANELIKKEISQQTIQYYDFAWLDTSAITVIDFSTTFNNYNTESIERVVMKRNVQSQSKVEV